MADSTDMKSKNKQNILDADLDAMLDEAELSLTSPDNQQTDEDVIDRLLMDAGFDANDELSPVVDDSLFPDEFDDNFDLADLSTDTQISDAEIHPDDNFKADPDFPLDLLNSIAISPDEDPNAPVASLDRDSEDLPIAPLDTLQDEMDSTDKLIPALDDSSLTDKPDDFLDFDEFSDFQDFQQPEIEDDDMDSAVGTSSSKEDVEQTPASSNLVMEEDDLIVDVADFAALDQATKYDEFGDDSDEYDSTISALTPATKTDENRQPHNEETSGAVDKDASTPPAEFDITADLDDDLTDDADQGNDFEDPTVPEATSMELEEMADETLSPPIPEKSADDLTSLIEAAGIPALLQFKSDQETVNKKYKKQITDFESSAKKASMITYAALGLGLAALITAVVLGVMIYGAKTEITRLTALVTTLEEDMGSIAANHFNQRVETAPDQPSDHQADATLNTLPAKSEASTDEAKQEHSPATPGHEPDNQSPEPQKTSTVVSEHSTSTIESQHSSTEPLKDEKPAPTTTSHELEHKSAEPPKEHAAVLEKQPSLSETSTAPVDALKKEVLEAPEKAPAAEPKPLELQETKPAVIEKKKTSITTSKKTTVKKKPKTVSAASNWSVNLIAYKQQWYASSKAAEFAQKGVPVEVIPVKLNNVTWYRLRVGGFNDREEASAYAGRVKKALNLSSVWVGNK